MNGNSSLELTEDSVNFKTDRQSIQSEKQRKRFGIKMNKASGTCGIISKLGMMSGTLQLESQEGREEMQRLGKLWRNHG